MAKVSPASNRLLLLLTQCAVILVCISPMFIHSPFELIPYDILVVSDRKVHRLSCIPVFGVDCVLRSRAPRALLIGRLRQISRQQHIARMLYRWAGCSLGPHFLSNEGSGQWPLVRYPFNAMKLGLFARYSSSLSAQESWVSTYYCQMSPICWNTS